MNPATIAIPDSDAVLVAATLKSMSLELLCRVGDEQPRPAEHRPGVAEIAGCKPRVFRAHRLGQTKRNRQDRRLFQGKAESENGPCRHVGDDRQIGTADEHAGSIDDLHEIDIGWGMVNLTDVERL